MKYYVDIDALDEIARKAGCKTNIELAEKIGINRNTVSEVMRGVKKPSSSFMYAFVDAFNVSGDTAGKIFFKTNLRNA